MKQQAKIVTHKGRLMAEVVRTEACQSCRACNFGQQERVYIDVSGVSCREGDTVDIEIHDSAVTKASAMAYGLPVAALFAGLLIGAAVSDTDYIQALCAAGGLAAGLALVKLIDRRIKRSGRYMPRVTVTSSGDSIKN